MSVTIDTKRNIAGIGHTGFLKDELLGYWTLGSNSTTQTDSLGFNNLTVSGTGITTNATGKIGTYAVEFSGTDGSGTMTLPVGAFLDKIVDRFTVAFWAKVDVYEAKSRYMFYFQRGTNEINFQIYFSNTAVGRIQFNYRDVDNNSEYTYSSVLTDTTNYQHICCICNGVGNAIKIYINGADDTQRADTQQNACFPWGYNSATSYRIGNTYTGGNYALDGTMCELGIWNRALSATDITNLYNGGTGRTYPFTGY